MTFFNGQCGFISVGSCCFLIALAKSRSAKGASQQPVFMGSCLGISHMHFPCLPSGRISSTCVLFPLMIGLIRNDGSADIFLYSVWFYFCGKLLIVIPEVTRTNSCRQDTNQIVI